MMECSDIALLCAARPPRQRRDHRHKESDGEHNRLGSGKQHCARPRSCQRNSLVPMQLSIVTTVRKRQSK